MNPDHITLALTLSSAPTNESPNQELLDEMAEQVNGGGPAEHELGIKLG